LGGNFVVVSIEKVGKKDIGHRLTVSMDGGLEEVLHIMSGLRSAEKEITKSLIDGLGGK
jgi:hypothetical protein